MLHKVHDETPGTVLPTESQIGKTCVHFSPLDGALASSAEDGSLYVWDTATCQTQDSYNNLHQVSLCTPSLHACSAVECLHFTSV